MATTTTTIYKSDQPDFLLKMVIVGDTGVGKTSLLLRYTDEKFSDCHISTIGVDFKIKNLEIDGGKIAKLQLWDTAGQERFKSIVSSFYRGADGLIVVFNVADMESFENLPKWMSDAEKYGSSRCLKMLVGNKVDLTSKRVVGRDTAQAFADRNGMAYIETSAKASTNVHSAFTTMAHNILDYQRDNGLTETGVKGHRHPDVTIPAGRNVNTGCFGGNYCSML